MSSIRLDERVQKATALPPRVKEDLYATQHDAKTRYQDWAFTQGSAIVPKKNNLKNGVYVWYCSRHRKDTKPTRRRRLGPPRQQE